MKLLFDLRWTGPEIAGISRYATELARAVAQRDDVELTVLVCNDEQKDLVPGVRWLMANDPQGDKPWQEALLPLRLSRHGFDVVYCPVFFMGLAPRRYKLVLTIHDLIPFEFPEPPAYISRTQALGWRFFYGTKIPMKICLSTADRVATVSLTMRRLIGPAMGLRDLDVIPNGVALREAGADADHAGSDHVVYMGVFSQHKNAEVLVHALVHAPEVRLHLLSRMPAVQQEECRALATSLGVAERLVIHDGVTDAEYVELLAGARCLVTASKREGFGLPIIEAQQQGVPVACSDIDIFHEVAGEVAEFFDPDSPEACAAAWERLRDPARSAELAAAGRENAARYTWARSADALVEVCRKALAG